MSKHLNALALLARASELATQAASALPETSQSADAPPTLEIDPSQAKDLQNEIQYQIYRYQAIADLHKFQDNARTAADKNMASAAPLVQRLDDYPTPGVDVDLTNLVSYPPRIEPVPIKPLFFDVAWNYIEYPGRAKKVVEQHTHRVNGSAEEPAPAQETGEPKKSKGWFGFGRS